MLRTIFLTSSTGVEGKNYPHIMRVIFLSRFSELTLLISKKADFGRYIMPTTKIWRSPLGRGKLSLIVYAVYKLFINRRKLNNFILFTEPSVIGIVGFLVKLFSPIKWVVDVWDIPIRYTGKNMLTKWRTGLTRRLMRLAYRQADLFIVGIRTDYQFKFFKIPDEKVLPWQTTIWIPNQELRSLRGVSDNYFNILCMKSMHDPACGLDVLLKAFRKVKGQIPEARLWIIGRIRQDAEEAIKELKDTEGVHFFGFLEHERVLQMINESHLTVIPWYNEVDLAQLYPTKVMEYMTEGKVVLAARVAGIADMIRDGVDGMLFQPGDSEDLAEKILMLYKDPDLRQKLAAKARLYQPKFDTVRKHEAIFHALKTLVNDPTPYDLTSDKDFLKKYTG